MLLERTLSTLQALGNERLQLPIFYESPLSLRFEIGPEDIPVNDPRYFRMAYWRTSFLYEKAPAFDTLLWVLYRTPDMDSDINELLDRFCKLARLPEPAEVYEQETVDRDGEPFTRIFFFWDMEETPPKTSALLDGILKTDFAGFLELSSAVFFFNTQTPFLLHLYDDRGMDLVAADKSLLSPFYEDCHNWLLDYDLPRMDEIFANTKGTESI